MRPIGAASWRDKDDHLVLLRNVLLSEEEEMSPATVRTTKRKGEATAEETLKK